MVKHTSQNGHIPQPRLKSQSQSNPHYVRSASRHNNICNSLIRIINATTLIPRSFLYPGVGDRGEACKPGSAKNRKAHLYTLPFMQENLQTGCKAIEDRQQQQASRQQNRIGNRIGNIIYNPIYIVS